MNLAKLLRKMDQCQRYLRTKSRAVTPFNKFNKKLDVAFEKTTKFVSYDKTI